MPKKNQYILKIADIIQSTFLTLLTFVPDNLMCFKDYLAQKLNKRLDILGTFVRGKFTFRGHFPGIGEVGISQEIIEKLLDPPPPMCF